MGCTSTKPVPKEQPSLIDGDKDDSTDLQPLKQSDTQCENNHVSRPASSTAVDSCTIQNNRLGSFSSYKGTKPNPLSVDCTAHNPNALNITPQNNGPQPGFEGNEVKDRHEQDLNRLAMFIPWEKPALGSKAKTRPKKKKSRGGVPGGLKTSGKKDNVFIPGTGTEKMLITKKEKTVGDLPPLTFKKVKANAETKSQIQKDREKIKKRKFQTKTTLKELKKCFTERDPHSNEYTQMRNNDASRDIVKLIEQYADFGAEAQTQFMVVSKQQAESMSSSKRITISCPVRAS